MAPVVVRVRGGRQKRVSITVEERIDPRELLVRVHLLIRELDVRDVPPWPHEQPRDAPGPCRKANHNAFGIVQSTDSRYTRACQLRAEVARAVGMPTGLIR